MTSRRRRRRAPRPAQRAVGYARASTSGQVLTIGAQRRKLEAWAEEQGLELLEVYSDQARSGALELERREGWGELLEGLAEHDAGVVLVVTRSRLARSILIAHQAEKELEFHGARLLDLETAHLGTGGAAELTRNILDAVHAEERRLGRERTMRIQADLRKQGKRWTKTPPYGWRWEDQRPVEVPHEQAALAALVRWRRRGLSIRRCRELLEQKGHKPRGAAWHTTTVARIVRRLEADGDT